MQRSGMRAALRASRAASSSPRGLATVTLPDLPYDFGALQPVVSGEIMALHHGKHHAAYVANFNAALAQYAEAEARGDVGRMIALQPALKFNGGGHVNHSIFWKNLCPPKARHLPPSPICHAAPPSCSPPPPTCASAVTPQAPRARAAAPCAAASRARPAAPLPSRAPRCQEFEPPSGDVLRYIEKDFGSVDALVKRFSAAAVGVQGSGWAWLGYDKAEDRLAVGATANQDPCATLGLAPLLGVDVWEHAYYLQYKNVRPDYVKAVWEIVNWKNVAENLAAATAPPAPAPKA